MAAADYHLCDLCAAKTFYDADLEGFHDPASGEWLYGWEGVSGYRAYALCKKCEETHEIVIQPRTTNADGMGGR
tara:strand:+ start:286 stop:507 length:222 start_codon:yes stop_codon:yes gene_type:complete